METFEEWERDKQVEEFNKWIGQKLTNGEKVEYTEIMKKLSKCLDWDNACVFYKESEE
jgi:hypothetical protein